MSTRNDRNQEFALPDGLKPRCVRAYDWSDEFTERALLGYRQFIKLKIQVEDFAAQTLYPSLTVELVWRQHILDVGHYCKSCADYCEGKLLDYNPDKGLGQAARHEQISATQVALKALFGRQVDAEVWSFNQKDDGVKTRPSMSVPESPTPRSSNSSVTTRNPTDNRTITLWIRDASGEATFFKLLRSTKLGKVFEAYARHKGVALGQLRFILDDHFVENLDLTPNDLNLVDQDSILAISVHEAF